MTTISNLFMKLNLTTTYRVSVFLVLLSLLMTAGRVQGQTKRRIEIERANTLEFAEDIDSSAQRLIGNVRLRHQQVLMFCDSAYSYQDKNMVDAFGNVHIIQGDTIHLYGNFLNYNGDTKIARVRENVKLVDQSITLTTDSLDFDLNTNVGYYTTGGEIIDTANVLTSRIGRYFSNDNLFYFRDSVKVDNNEFTLYADTLKYNSATERVIMVGPTTIESKNEDGELYSEDGWYDTRLNVAELYKASKLRRNDQLLEGDTLYYSQNSGNGEAHHSVRLTDLENKTIITGRYALYNEISNKAIVTDSAVFMQYSDTDTLFMHADTLRSIPDTSSVDEDSKLFLAYYNVRFYRHDLQGQCDSLTYQMSDSTISMFDDPVLWSQNNQMTAEKVSLISNETDPDLVMMEHNAFIISEEDKLKYNQINGKNMVGYIRNNHLYKVDVNGNGRSYYYAKDEEKYVGLNMVESSNIVINMKDSHINNITFVTKPDASMIPLNELDPEASKLKGFNWRYKERPKNKTDIFPREKEEEVIPD